MILFILRDGSYTEISEGVDVMHRHQTLACIDKDGQTIVTLKAGDVIAYTCTEACAERMKSGLADQQAAATGRELPADC
jgi:hypothetical protein